MQIQNNSNINFQAKNLLVVQSRKNNVMSKVKIYSLSNKDIAFVQRCKNAGESCPNFFKEDKLGIYNGKLYANFGDFCKSIFKYDAKKDNKQFLIAIRDDKEIAGFAEVDTEKDSIIKKLFQLKGDYDEVVKKALLYTVLRDAYSRVNSVIVNHLDLQLCTKRLLLNKGFQQNENDISLCAGMDIYHKMAEIRNEDRKLKFVEQKSPYKEVDLQKVFNLDV